MPLAPEPARIAAALAHIPADDRETWLRMAMAVRSALGDAGHPIWDEWSRSSDRYNERDARDVWRSVRPDGGIGIGTLFAEAKHRGWQGNGHGHGPEPLRTARQLPQEAPRPRACPIPDEALASRPKAHPRHGTPSATWVYRDAQGRPTSFVLRFDPPGQRKLFVPQTWDGTAWRWQAPPAPRPLYGLDRLAARPDAPVVICEGEKAAAAAAELMPDHAAVTAPNGAAAAGAADWAPLAGRVVRIWPDHDEPGAKHAEAVAELVAKAGARTVEVLDVAAFGPTCHGWDAADALADGWTAESFAERARWTARAEPPPRWPLIWLPDAKPHVSEPALIRGLCKPGAMLVTYGESNSGKSFHVLDRDLCLAAGRPWYGRETAGGFVLYVAAEGARSIETRVAAYRDAFLRDAGAVPFAILPATIDLRRPDADTRPLIDFVRRIEDARGIRCVKVTADTLARAMQGGNENSSEDMGAVIGHADLIRAEIGCAFEFVAHSGKDASKGTRGWSGLRAATDTEIEVTARDGLHVATVTKQRDYGRDGDAFGFRLRVIELGTDPYGHPVTTCVPEWVDAPDKAGQRRRLSPTEQAVLAAIKEVMTKDRQTPPPSCYDAPTPPKGGQFAAKRVRVREQILRTGSVSPGQKADTLDRSIRRALQSLRAHGIIEVYDDWVWLTDKADKGGQSGNCPPAKSGWGADGHGQHPIRVSGLSAPPDGQLEDVGEIDL